MTDQHPTTPEERMAEEPVEDIIRIKGVPPYDGDWPADLSRFTNRELRTIKKVSGIKAAQLQAALLEGDQDALVALTVVMLQRSGQYAHVSEDLRWDADSNALEFVTAEEQQEAVEDPNSPQPSESTPEPPGSHELGSATTTSGESGEPSSETTEEGTQPPTGTPPSDSDPPTSET
jgi:hypothetical protein